MAKTSIKPTPEDKQEEKKAEGKKASKAAGKKAQKNKMTSEAKKLSDKMILDIAASLPSGQGNAFVQLNIKHDKADEMVAAAIAVRRQVRAEFKAIKVDMDVLNLARKGRKMDPDDWTAKKVTLALYEKQLGMKLTEEQEALVQGIEVKRENTRAAMSTLDDGNAGKEVGSSPIGHNSEAAGVNQANAVPEKNEKVGAGFRHPEKTTAPTAH